MDSTISELYFLIAKFLSGGPCQRASQTLIEELESNEIIPKSVNWLGEGVSQDYKTFSSKFNHINPDHLPKLLEQLIKIVNAREHASTVASRSLLSTSTLALLDKADLTPRKSSTLTWSKKNVSHQVRQFKNRKNVSHPVHAISERSISGTGVGNHLIKPDIYQRMAIACNTLGHLSAVYCVLFDITGRYIFTGADDHLVKIWSAIDGRLLFTFRGTTSEITDLAVNQENTLIAVASCDKTIRVWCLRTCAPVAVLTAHSGNVTSVFFCPVPRSRSVIRYLASTSTDGSCAFWAYTDDPGEPIQFQPKPTLYLERMRPGSAQMICSSFSPGGCFMAAGSADNHVRVYYMLGIDGPERILEVEHHSERVDSISWAHEGIKFVSGSKDGTALIWRFDSGCWRYIRLHCGKNPGEPAVIFEDPKRRPRVTMVGWNADDSLVLTAVSDHMIKVWSSSAGELIRVLKGHTDEAYVIEAHPFNPRVVCTAGHDGKLIIWDVGTVNKDEKDSSIGKVYEYYNQLGEGHGQGHGSLFDCKWSPDGFSIAMTDSHGHVMLLTVSGDQLSKFKKLPSELFFHTDYRPILRDAITNQILDEQTQVAPHLMPPPFLVDVDGNPYPPHLQRLVPGRERLKEEYLIPNVAVGASGYQEVIEGIPARSNIDEMIQQLAIEQGLARNREAAERENERSRGIGNRRSGEVEGVRQSRGDWQPANCSVARKYIIPPLPDGVADSLEEIRFAAVEAEEAYYRDQSSKMSPSSNSNVVLGSPVDCSPNGRARRLRMLARDAAERRRNQPATSSAPEFMETEGVARPNPRPQMEISVSQESPRRYPRARRPNPVNGTARRPRPVRFDVRRTLRENGESDLENVEIEEDSFSEAHVSTTDSSSSEDSDSDWGGTLGTSKSREENKRKSISEGRKRSQRLHSNSSGEDSTKVKQEPEESETGDPNDDNEPQPGPSSDIKIKTEPVKQTRTRKARSKQVDYSGGLEEIPELYRPSEWLSEILPKRSPYLPQLGDDLVYYRQGHEAYIKEIEAKKTYTIPNKLKKQLPYVQKPDLEPEVSVRVIAIKFELEPPRLVALKLARTDWKTGELINGSHFYVKYHDIADVVDFLILRQMYDRSTTRRWNDGDKFRCLIQGEWWLGTILQRSPYSQDYQDSNYLCYEVQWNSGEPERMSPWDMDIVTDDFEIPSDYDPNNGIPASSEDLRIGMYESTAGDWPPHGHQEAQCQKISLLLEQVMSLAISEAFLTPVDLNMYPDYAHTIEYPIDLSTIKARLDNLFYRRVDALRFDIKYIAMNAEKFNQLDSAIVKNSRVIRDVCLEIANSPDTIDVNAFYHATMKKYTNASKVSKSDGSGSKSKNSSNRTSKKAKKKDKEIKEEYISEEEQVAWESQCLEILNDIFERDDATPFRQPVDITVFPDYSRVIDTPMDLQTVREELLGGNYESPQDFHKDMMMIFSNSRHYNTDLRSKIYLMTRRLQSAYESRYQEFTKSMKRSRKGKKSAVKANESSKLNSRFKQSKATSSANSTPRKNPKRSASSKNRYINHEDESSDALDESGHYLRNRTKATKDSSSLNGSARKNIRNGHAGPSSSKTNGYASSSPQRYSTRNSSGARPVKRLRISSGDSHPSTRNSPRRGVALNRLSNTSSHGSTTPDGPSTSRAALKRAKIPVKDEPSDEFEDSDDDESVSMPVLNEEQDRSDDPSDYDSDDHHTAVRRSSRVITKRSHNWNGRSRRETRNQERPNYAEPQDATDDESERRFGKRRRLAPTRTSPMRAASVRPIPNRPPALRKSDSFNNSDSEHDDEEDHEESEVSDEEFDPDKPGPSSKLIRHMNKAKKVTNGNSSLRNGKAKPGIKSALHDDEDEDEDASEDVEEEHVDEEESEEEGGSEEGESDEEEDRGRSQRGNANNKLPQRNSPRKGAGTKRRHDSSDDEYTSSPARRSTKASGPRGGGGGNKRTTRGVKINYGEGSDDDDSEPTRVTVSSRGRVRRTKSFLGD